MHVAEQARITPADAGKTLSVRLAPSAFQDHPRGCGENATLRQPIGATRGSPPRMRGKPPFRLRSCSQSRITPADAGKTLRSLASVRSSQDHPRGCGENSNAFMKIALSPGSPPRMRGKRLDGLASAPTAVDHPRGCGENAAHKWAYQTVMGSPPRMRGKPIMAKVTKI